MTTAIVGYTGFVGGNLLAKRDFDDQFNSANVGEIAGRHYDRVVFAAAKAEKWRINQDPEADLVHIAELEQILSSFTTDQLVLISTVDVYKNPVGVDEDTPIDTDGLHAYGLHRYQLERFAAIAHENTSVVRLPGLFGPGIKKNVIYDLLNDNNVDRINSRGSFQYYNLQHLADDLDVAVEAGIPLINLTSEPVRTDEIAKAAFGIDFDQQPEGTVAGSYDMRTKYAQLFGNAGSYTYTREQTLGELAAFVAAEKSAA